MADSGGRHSSHGDAPSYAKKKVKNKFFKEIKVKIRKQKELCFFVFFYIAHDRSYHYYSYVFKGMYLLEVVAYYLASITL